jgi:tRNA pseudouridine32 synthase/23S rRNA pseudouridine746 synthase/23S rRNA pseudouridine1911/1915/1917 synthase
MRAMPAPLRSKRPPAKRRFAQRPRPDARVSGSSPAPAPALSPEQLLARVLYRDGLILVLDKPAGLPVHAGPGGGPNLEALFDALRFGLPKPPALAHRLDRDTSGCLVLGRHRKALAKLGRLFASGEVEKTYWAVVDGAPPHKEGRVELALRKLTRKTGWRMVVDPEGQAAVTDYRVLGQADGKTWLECKPKTGRTHQIRVHCAALGCPVSGDPVYGPAGAAPRGQLLLHARAIRLPLYPSKPPIEVTAPVPPHMRAALEACGFSGEELENPLPSREGEGPIA